MYLMETESAELRRRWRHWWCWLAYHWCWVVVERSDTQRRNVDATLVADARVFRRHSSDL